MEGELVCMRMGKKEKGEGRFELQMNQPEGKTLGHLYCVESCHQARHKQNAGQMETVPIN